MNYDNLYNNSKYILQKKDVAPLIAYFKRKRGYVYIATSSSHSFLKIGRTSKNPIQRAKTLSTTGVLHDYNIIFSLKCLNSYWFEKHVHQLLKKNKQSKEFFDVSIDIAIQKFVETSELENKILSAYFNLSSIEEDIELLSLN